mmetsp:Transcript_61916/g.141793  ORF Transcript_61916/g.141793 Transcript_61916/m.141793 type:complete len:607 (-) Transcript_61916:76-1896(-)
MSTRWRLLPLLLTLFVMPHRRSADALHRRACQALQGGRGPARVGKRQTLQLHVLLPHVAAPPAASRVITPLGTCRGNELPLVANFLQLIRGRPPDVAHGPEVRPHRREEADDAPAHDDPARAAAAEGRHPPRHHSVLLHVQPVHESEVRRPEGGLPDLLQAVPAPDARADTTAGADGVLHSRPVQRSEVRRPAGGLHDLLLDALPAGAGDAPADVAGDGAPDSALHEAAAAESRPRAVGVALAALRPLVREWQRVARRKTLLQNRPFVRCFDAWYDLVFETTLSTESDQSVGAPSTGPECNTECPMTGPPSSTHSRTSKVAGTGEPDYPQETLHDVARAAPQPGVVVAARPVRPPEELHDVARAVLPPGVADVARLDHPEAALLPARAVPPPGVASAAHHDNHEEALHVAARAVPPPGVAAAARPDHPHGVAHDDARAALPPRVAFAARQAIPEEALHADARAVPPLGVADADRRDHPDDALHDWPAPGMPFLRRSDLLQLRGCSTNLACCVDVLLQRAAERQHGDRGFSPLGVASEAPARFCSNVPPAPLASSRLSPLSLPPIPAFPAFQSTHEYTSALRVSGPALPAARELPVRLSTTTAHVWK